MYKVFKGLRGKQLIAVLSGICCVTSIMISTVLLQRIIVSFVKNDLDDIGRDLILFSFALIGNVISTFIFQYYYRLLGYIGSIPIRQNLLGMIINGKDLNLKNFSKSDLVTIVSDDSEKISKVYSAGVVNITIEMVQFLMTMALIAYYNAVIAILLLGLVICGIWFIHLFSGRMGQLSVRLQELSRVMESLDCIRTIKMLNKETYVLNEYQEILKEKEAIAKKLQNILHYMQIYLLLSVMFCHCLRLL